MSAFKESEQTIRQLRIEGAMSPKFWAKQLLSLADAASMVGREDIAARLTCHAAEMHFYRNQPTRRDR